MFDENNNNDFGSGKIDYQGLAQNLASQVPDVLDSDIPELNRQYIIKKVQNYCVLAGEALNNDNTFCSTQDEKIFIVQIVGEWTYHKCLDLYRSHVSAEYYEEILQKIAFVVYEIAKQGIIRKIEQRDLIDVIEYHVVKTYKEALDELKDKDAISEEIYQLAINESNLDKLAEKFGKDDSDLDELQSISFSPLKDLESSSSSALVLNEEAKSSLVKALEKTKEDPDCIGMVSAGSTGAVLTGALLRIGRIRGISRPALAPVLPTLTGGHTLLIDCGANVDCKPNMLEQFALMGNAYMKAVYGIENPRVGLLCNGTEDEKGNQLVKETFPLLKQLPINFVGNMEARDITTGEYDVVVADGFAGNVALKASEGIATTMLKMIKNEIYSSLKTKIAGAMLKKSFGKIRNLMDYNQNGGAPFIGVEKLVIKSHGSSKAKSICGSIMQVYEMHKSDLIGKIKESLAQVKTEE